jgi:hypothetical protein
MQPYWIKIDAPRPSLGVGITAISEDDARALFRLAWPEDRIASIAPIRDMRDIEQNHVAPNMGNWFKRGIWYPMGHDQIS